MLRKLLLAAGLVFGALPASAMDQATFDRVLAEARIYAADMTLVFYCLRQDPAMGPFRYAMVHGDLEASLKRLKANASDERQNALFLEAVMATVRFAPADARDASADARCEAAVKALNTLSGSGMPLHLRLAFLPNKS